MYYIGCHVYQKHMDFNENPQHSDFNALSAVYPQNELEYINVSGAALALF